MKQRPPVIKKFPPPRIEIINLIDVLITLVAFFLLTMVLPENRGQLEIELPRAEQALSTASAKEVVLELTVGHELFLNSRPVAREELPPLLSGYPPDTPTVIRADRDCQYQEIIDLLDLCARSGLHRVALAVKDGG
ncbi:MAG: biopolymer transporter ExbD [Firmicutes bacterium]|jgi:biopolymer transport protein ExbD|nr:biopolymer transporter ExbD [Bacillota bacterium]